MTEKEKNEYAEYVKRITPKHNCFMQVLRAFLVGGAICLLGQFLLNFGEETLLLDEKTTGSFCTLVLIGISVLLTAAHMYNKIVSFGGAGALVPITGFANGVASAAIEFKKEGMVFGTGCKIFMIAGPVILYGILSSWVLGIIYYCVEYVI